MLQAINPLLALSLVLIVGVLGGALAKRLRLPSVTGQILFGVLLGPAALGVFDRGAIDRLQPLTHFAVGLMAVAVGNHLHLRRLRNAKKRLSLLAVFEILFVPTLVLAVLLVVARVRWEIAIVLAAVSIETAPATTLSVVKDARAKGVFVKTLIAGLALDNIACLCLFAIAETAAEMSLHPSPGQVPLDLVLSPLRELAASALLGAGVGVGLVLATRKVVRSDRLATASVIAILLTAGLSDHLDISMPLSCLFLGVALANVRADREEIGHSIFHNFEGAIFAIFFTLAGMELEFGYLLPAAVPALLAVAARGVGKVGAAGLAMRAARATRSLERWLGPAMLPQAGLTVGLILSARENPLLASVRSELLAVGLSVVTINEIMGPVLTRVALARAGDAGKDRARVIDFLHEENIVTDFEARTMEEAIEKLVDVLVQTNRLAIDRSALLASVLERERTMSTCLGDGLAIPHGELAGHASMLGAMGVSRRGLAFDTPDGQPVRCLILIATPASARDRHLEVLAALARAVGSDAAIRDQLYDAKSPAHAYELLHAREGSADYNYFLDDEQAG